MHRNAGGRKARPPPERLLEKKNALVSCDGNETESLQDLSGPETNTVKSISLSLSSLAVAPQGIVYPNPKVFVAGTAVGKQLCVERGNLT